MLIKPDRPSLPPSRDKHDDYGFCRTCAKRSCDGDCKLNAAIDRVHTLRLLKALEKVEAELRAKGAIE